MPVRHQLVVDCQEKRTCRTDIQYRMYTSFFILVIEIISDIICDMTDEGVPDLDSLTQDETECGNGIIKPDDRLDKDERVFNKVTYVRCGG